MQDGRTRGPARDELGRARRDSVGWDEPSARIALAVSAVIGLVIIALLLVIAV